MGDTTMVGRRCKSSSDSVVPHLSRFYPFTATAAAPTTPSAGICSGNWIDAVSERG